ncbi:MAG: hypothetical protein AWU54_1790 [Candidatus Frackibacter sp. T328-2]|nr:MAG: hypothetical protein AWU54_1790 [Candidatus Frackibacter sp. T328-2]
MKITVKFIRKWLNKGNIVYTDHAQERMKERKIKSSKVVEAILNGKPIEKQDHDRDMKIIFQEATNDIPECYVVVAADTSTSHAVVVTVCKTKKEVWDFINGLMARK